MVECQLCHREFSGNKLNPSHLTTAHEITVAKYASLYPEQIIWLKYSRRCIVCNSIIYRPGKVQNHGRKTTKFCDKKCMGKYYSMHGPPGKPIGTIRKEQKYYSPGFTGKSHTNKTKKILREIAYKRIENNIKNNKKDNLGGQQYIKDLGHSVRSGWEANIARLFKYLEIKYVYEQEISQLCFLLLCFILNI